jgi:hypothetical protein
LETAKIALSNIDYENLYEEFQKAKIQAVIDEHSKVEGIQKVLENCASKACSITFINHGTIQIGDHSTINRSIPTSSEKAKPRTTIQII